MIGVIIPDRGDRPEFLANCLRMLKAQTIQPTIIEIVNDAPLSDEKDITWRYRLGYERLRNKGIEVISLIENDDWYAPNYLETMYNKWLELDKPELLGQGYTIYYHIKERAWFTMNHPERSSAMNTLIKPDLHFDWCVDNDPYTDLHLWLHAGLKGEIFTPKSHICLGIKHGDGLCGGVNHVDALHRYTNFDYKFWYLKSILDSESFNFYSKYFYVN